MPRHNFCRPDGRLVKLFIFSTLLDKSPLTSVYFATFEKKGEVRSPLPHNRIFWFLVNNKSFNLCGRKSPEIPFHTRRTIIKLGQAGNSQWKRVRDLSISHIIVQSIFKKFQNTGFV